MPHTPAGSGSAVTFRHALVIDGQVAGTWNHMRSVEPPIVRITPARRLTSRERELVERVSRRYGSFLRTPVRVEFGS